MYGWYLTRKQVTVPQPRVGEKKIEKLDTKFVLSGEWSPRIVIRNR